MEDGTARVTEPRILNGAQTLTTLARFIEKNREHPEFRKRMQRLEELEVLVKVIDEAEGPFTVGVTICTNKRTRSIRGTSGRASRSSSTWRTGSGRSWDLLRTAGEELGELSAGRPRGDGGRREPEADPDPAAGPGVPRRAGRARPMSRLGDVFEDEKVFRRTFPSRTSMSTRGRSSSSTRSTSAGGPSCDTWRSTRGRRSSSFRRCWNLVQALVQALFNHKDLSSWLDRFGSTTSMETDYTDILRGPPPLEGGPGHQENGLREPLRRVARGREVRLPAGRRPSSGSAWTRPRTTTGGRRGRSDGVVGNSRKGGLPVRNNGNLRVTVVDGAACVDRVGLVCRQPLPSSNPSGRRSKQPSVPPCFRAASHRCLRPPSRSSRHEGSGFRVYAGRLQMHVRCDSVEAAQRVVTVLLQGRRTPFFARGVRPGGDPGDDRGHCITSRCGPCGAPDLRCEAAGSEQAEPTT